MNYKLPYLPKDMQANDRCFIVWNGKVRGWMEIVEVVKLVNGFTCTTTGKYWGIGVYMRRSGPFHAIEGPEIKGFQGIRKYKESP